MLTLRALPMLALLAASSPGATSSTEDAELLLTNGVFYPASEGQLADGTPTAVRGALAVRGGRIIFLGDAVAAVRLRGANTKVIDLAGRAVTPGLIDAHAHLAGLGDELGRVDLAGTTSYAEVVARVAEAARQVPAGTWIRGRGWDQNDWDAPGHPFPDQRALSAAVPDHPVWLTRVDGHASLLNARALAELGVGNEVVDPSGGKFLRFPDGGLTGVLVDNAADELETRLPQPDRAERMRRLRLAAERCLALGLTTVTDMGVDAATLDAYVALRDHRDLPIRAAVFLTDDPQLLADAYARGPRLDPQARLVVRGVKLYADGALGSRGAALVEPYDDDPTNLGLLRTSTDHVAAVATAAIAHGFQVGIHAIGDRGNLIALDGIERAFGGLSRPELRFRIEHAQVMRVQDIARMAHLGVVASMQPTHATSDMPWAGERVGEARLAGAYAWRKVLVAGGRLALGSDFPVESADPRLGLYAAVSRQDLAGNPPGGWRPEERLSRAEALRGFTRDAAWSLFLEHETGALEVGRRADLVVWANDPMTVPMSGIPTAAVDLTLLDGKIVYRREASP